MVVKIIWKATSIRWATRYKLGYMAPMLNIVNWDQEPLTSTKRHIITLNMSATGIKARAIPIKKVCFNKTSYLYGNADRICRT